VRVWCLCVRICVCACVRCGVCVWCGVVCIFLKMKQHLAGKIHAGDDLQHAACCHGPVE
jgi:hypothetical protein